MLSMRASEVVLMLYVVAKMFQMLSMVAEVLLLERAVAEVPRPKFRQLMTRGAHGFAGVSRTSADLAEEREVWPKYHPKT